MKKIIHEVGIQYVEATPGISNGIEKIIKKLL